jgi:hypothetical protein
MMRRVWLATGVLVALVAAGCGDDARETGRPPTAAARPAVTVVSKSPLVRIVRGGNPCGSRVVSVQRTYEAPMLYRGTTCAAALGVLVKIETGRGQGSAHECVDEHCWPTVIDGYRCTTDARGSFDNGYEIACQRAGKLAFTTFVNLEAGGYVG